MTRPAGRPWLRSCRYLAGRVRPGKEVLKWSRHGSSRVRRLSNLAGYPDSTRPDPTRPVKRRKGTRPVKRIYFIARPTNRTKEEEKGVACSRLLPRAGCAWWNRMSVGNRSFWCEGRLLYSSCRLPLFAMGYRLLYWWDPVAVYIVRSIVDRGSWLVYGGCGWNDFCRGECCWDGEGGIAC